MTCHDSWLYFVAGPPGIPVLKTQNSPRQRKNSRKFPFGKMIDFARSNTISTQTSNIWINYNDMVSLQKCTYATWSIKSWNLPKCQCHQQLSIHPTCRESRLTGSDRSSSGCINNRLPPSGQTSPKIRAPYSGDWNFRQFFYTIWYAGHLLTSGNNFTEIVPGEPLRRGS